MLRRMLWGDTALEILESTTAYDDAVALIFDRQAEAGSAGQIVCDRMDWTHPNRARYYERNRAFIATVSPLRGALTEDPIQVMFNGPVAVMRRLVEQLAPLGAGDRFAVALTEYEARDFALVDVNGPGCSKGSTLARWSASLGFTPSEVMAVGDNLNDLEMLEFAGTPVIMGNAVPALRSRGFLETASHDENGLALAIRRFALGADTR
jgi:hydroxymethylpyrimidine pyrophosphatase-like HAD family hydrolase